MTKQKKTVYKKKEGRKGLLPQIPRRFPAIPRFHLIVVVVFLLFLSLLFVISCIVLLKGYFLQKEERNEVLQRLVKAQKVIKEHPEQPEAYYTAALYAIRIKDFETAKTYLSQALFLNPDMNEAKILLQQVEGKL